MSEMKTPVDMLMKWSRERGDKVWLVQPRGGETLTWSRKQAEAEARRSGLEGLGQVERAALRADVRAAQPPVLRLRKLGQLAGMLGPQANPPYTVGCLLAEQLRPRDLAPIDEVEVEALVFAVGHRA